jgi:GcrA cell cycle regulator
MSWTDERIATLTKMWESGATASQIADELGGVSRNAVIGKAHRLGLKARPSPVKPNEEKETAKAPDPLPVAKAKPKLKVPPPAPKAAPSAVAKPTGDQQAPIPPAPPRRLVPARPSPEIADKTSLLDLNDRVCRWPMGHPGEPDFHFCGEKVNPGFPYCVEHCGRAYQAQLPRGARRPPPPLPFGGPRVR